MDLENIVIKSTNKIYDFVSFKRMGLLKPHSFICEISAFSYLISFIENIDIFDDDEKQKINELYNQLMF